MVTAHLWRFRDATHQRRLEESVRQAQRLNTVGRLAGGIAHDFNNLLTAVVGYCDLLDTQFDNGDPRRFDLHEIRNAAIRASSLTRQLLAFSRRQIMQPEIVDVGMMLGEMPKMLSRLMGEQVKVAITVPDEPAEVYADPGQIEQAIFSLAANARDAMPDGGTFGVDVRVRAAGRGARASARHARRSGGVRDGVGQRQRHGRRHACQCVRPVLHDQATGAGPRAADRLRDRPADRRGGHAREHAGRRHARGDRVAALQRRPVRGARVAGDGAPATSERAGPAVVLVVEDEASVLRLVRRVLEAEAMVGAVGAGRRGGAAAHLAAWRR